MKVAMLIPAAGASSRFGGKVKKQFAEIDGRAVFVRTLEAFSERNDISQIIMAIANEDKELFDIKWSAKLGFFGVKVIIGGQERHDTVNKLLAEVKDDADMVALHDAVRPCITQQQIDNVFAAADQYGAAILASPLTGTIKKADTNMQIIETIDRSELWQAQTPQVFMPDIIRKAYQLRDKIIAQNINITDDAQLVEATGTKVHIVPSDEENIKITNSIDLTIAAAILKERRKQKQPKGPAGPWAAEQNW